MKLLWLTWVNIKRFIKNPQILLMLLVLPAIMITFIFGQSDTSVNQMPSITIFNQDDSEESTKLIEELKKDFKINFIIETSKEEVYGMVQEGKYSEVFNIEDDFGKKIKNNEKPSVKIITTAEGNGSMQKKLAIDEGIEKITTGKEPAHVINAEIEVNSKENDSQILMLVLMICYFMMLSGGVIAEEIIKLKSENIIKRCITTANKDMEILAGIFIGIFVLQAVCTSIVFIGFSKFMGINVTILPQIILVIVLCSGLSTAITMAAARWLKTPALAELTVVVYGLITFILSMVSINLGFLGEVPDALVNLSKISPFYWMSNILNSTDVVMSIAIIILMSICFFTAGSFKLRNFARD
ncbi:MAG: ABC transporter permease [Clostridium sp.]